MPEQGVEFATCEGSMTSEDRMTFYCHTKREDGQEFMAVQYGLDFYEEDLADVKRALRSLLLSVINSCRSGSTFDGISVGMESWPQ